MFRPADSSLMSRAELLSCWLNWLSTHDSPGTYNLTQLRSPTEISLLCSCLGSVASSSAQWNDVICKWNSPFIHLIYLFHTVTIKPASEQLILDSGYVIILWPSVQENKMSFSSNSRRDKLGLEMCWWSYFKSSRRLNKNHSGKKLHHGCNFTTQKKSNANQNPQTKFIATWYINTDGFFEAKSWKGNKINWKSIIRGKSIHNHTTNGLCHAK